MATNFVQNGNVLNYTAGADISSGDFILMGKIGAVALTDIANGDEGSAQVSGVFSVAKATGAITQGAKLYWDSSASKLTTTVSSNTVVGVAAAAAADADATVDILLNIGL